MAKNLIKLRKNILLAGNPGFLAEPIIQCFRKEGWEAFTLDDGAFTLHNQWGVLYFALEGIDDDLAMRLKDALQYKVKQFCYISQGHPDQRCYEEFVLAWGRTHDLPVTVIRLPEVFGPGQEADEGPIARLFWSVRLREKFQLRGAGDTEVPVLYFKDAVYGVFRAFLEGKDHERVVITSQEKFTFRQLVEELQSFTTLPEVEFLNTGEEFIPVSEEEGTLQIHPGSKYPVRDMVMDTWGWYGERVAGDLKEQEWQAKLEKVQKAKKSFAVIRPYLENLILVVMVTIIFLLQGNTTVNTITGLDICYIYIIIMGLLYGKQQSMLSIIPSAILLTISLLLRGEDLVAILYIPENILHYTTYLFVGVFAGYIADSWRGEVDTANYKLAHVKQRYDILKQQYQSAITIKDKLYRQIVNSDDSIGWLYGIIRQLDSVAVENIFTQAAVITGRIMEVKDVAIYVMGQGQFYMRQKVRMGELTKQLPQSRKTEEHAYIRNMLSSHHLFVNHGLQSGVPDLAAPIIYDGKVIAVIEIYGMDFDQWNIYYQNLLSVSTRLISMAIGKAYMYEEGVQAKRFIPGTRILREDEFLKMEQEFKDRNALEENTHNVLLELDAGGRDYQELDRLLVGAVRQEDSLGVKDGAVFLLLQGAGDVGVSLVQRRLADRGIAVKSTGELV